MTATYSPITQEKITACGCARACKRERESECRKIVMPEESQGKYMNISCNFF